MQHFNFIVIGGGAAGYFAAIQAANRIEGKSILILEATRQPLTKVKISGGGRCNVTHNCFDPRTLIQNYPRGGRELQQAFHHFQPADTVRFFEERGIRLQTERDGRMFPVTNRSETIIDCFEKECQKHGIRIELGERVEKILPITGETHDASSQVRFILSSKSGKQWSAANVLLATGSGAQGHQLAESIGHTIEKTVPSLFTFKIDDPLLAGLQGVSFTRAQLKLLLPSLRKPIVESGPVLVTHWGLSGPAVLRLSAFAARELFDAGYCGELKVNWLGQTEAQAFERLLGTRNSAGKDSALKCPFSDLTKRFWAKALELCQLSAVKPKEISNQRLQQLSKLLTGSKLIVAGKGMFKEEFVTCGGVRRSEIDFKCMESRRHPGLFFAGEVIDVDGVTGGFNFQNAWTGAAICANHLRLDD